MKKSPEVQALIASRQSDAAHLSDALALADSLRDQRDVLVKALRLCLENMENLQQSFCNTLDDERAYEIINTARKALRFGGIR